MGQRTAEYGTDAPKIPTFKREESVKRNTLGWVIDRSFTPISVGNTFIFDVVEDTGSNLVYVIETLARAEKKHVSLVPGVLKRSG